MSKEKYLQKNLNIKSKFQLINNVNYFFIFFIYNNLVNTLNKLYV